MDWQNNSIKIQKLLQRIGKPLNEEAILREIAGTMDGIIAGELRFTMLCDERLEEVEDGIYALRTMPDGDKSISQSCTEDNHQGFVKRLREAFEELGMESDSSLLGQSNYPDIGLLCGEKSIAIDCWEMHRGEVKSEAMTLADMHRRNYQHILGREVKGCMIVTGYFTQEAIDNAYYHSRCGLLRSSTLDMAVDFSRRFELTTGELTNLFCLKGSLDIRLEALIEGRRDDMVEMTAILTLLKDAEKPLSIWEIGTGLTNMYSILISSDRLSSLLSRLETPPLDCIEEQNEEWTFRHPLPKDGVA